MTVTTASSPSRTRPQLHQSTVAQTLALSKRSILSLWRQPSLVVPSLIFPLFFAALGTSSFSRATTEVPGFPAVDSYLDFALAGSVVQGILFGSTVFSFTFNAADGHIWVEDLFDKLPGGQIGFLLFVNLLVFILGMFIDFFEIAFIVVPLLVPVATKLDINLIWFGIILAMNLQTSFLTPPFGFALFYLRGVAPPSVATEDIYRGVVPFIIIQLLLMLMLSLWPTLATWLPAEIYN